jgi:hypothetical protein
MFDSKTNITDRLTDAVDLFIDFATLGEYGLEPVGRTRQGCVDLTPTSTQSTAPGTAPRSTRERPKTRTIHRSGQCNLLEESGLFRSPRRGLSQTSSASTSGCI